MIPKTGFDISQFVFLFLVVLNLVLVRVSRQNVIIIRVEPWG